MSNLESHILCITNTIRHGFIVKKDECYDNFVYTFKRSLKSFLVMLFRHYFLSMNGIKRYTFADLSRVVLAKKKENHPSLA